jgi:hypothetical protein
MYGAEFVGCLIRGSHSGAGMHSNTWVHSANGVGIKSAGAGNMGKFGVLIY